MYMILGPILKLANFEVYPTDSLYNFLFGFTETESFDQIFAEAGIRGSNFIEGTGTLFISVVVFLIWLPVQQIISNVSSKYGYQSKKGIVWLTRH